MSELDIYDMLNKIRQPGKREKFPYDIEFTKKIIELKTDNGRIFYDQNSKDRRSGGSKGSQVRIYEFSNS